MLIYYILLLYIIYVNVSIYDTITVTIVMPAVVFHLPEPAWQLRTVQAPAR